MNMDMTYKSDLPKHLRIHHRENSRTGREVQEGGRVTKTENKVHNISVQELKAETDTGLICAIRCGNRCVTQY